MTTRDYKDLLQKAVRRVVSRGYAICRNQRDEWDIIYEIIELGEAAFVPGGQYRQSDRLEEFARETDEDQDLLKWPQVRRDRRAGPNSGGQ